MKTIAKYTTGLKGLDDICNGLRLGDNVVWQVDSIEDYRLFLIPFAEKAIADGNRLVYLRFARHDPLLQQHQYNKMYILDSFSGFESFSAAVHTIIKSEGREVYYAFDSLSDLQSAWATDLMIGNFFMITCPFLFELDTIAYFSIHRNSISFNTIATIRETTQLLIDVYNAEGNLYVHPLKVWNRYSPTMFFPHLKKGDSFTPITSSVDAARLITHIQKRGIESTLRTLDYWDRIFLKVEDLILNPENIDEIAAIHQIICKAMITRDERILALANKYFTLEDFVVIKDRLIGTGFIGGKTVGMLLARKILESDPVFHFEQILEPHDSFFIGSDVFYSYIVQNGWWKIFMEHKTDAGYFTAASQLYEKMLHGKFPDTIKEKFQQIIEYYGQSPIIVRSSSLLEDGYGNAFAGKYESYFLVNQGNPQERFEKFTTAVQKIYASTMDEDALTYRLQRGLHKLDEQMGLLVQRVSGSYHRHYFFPDTAGVGLSHNTFVWKPDLDPKAGMLRMVMGLGTRAVNRVEGDYPRIIALDDPLVKPYAGMEDARKFSQHSIDLLNINDNELVTVPVDSVVGDDLNFDMNLIAIRDAEIEQYLRDRGNFESEAWIINFDNLLMETPFSSDMRAILQTLEKAYDYPVDIEYTANFTPDRHYRINVLQCRPQQTKWQTRPVKIPESIDREAIVFSTAGNFIGGSVVQPVKRIIFVDPFAYGDLPLTQKYDIARLIGRVNRECRDRKSLPTMLMGPGRWGTTTPSLGVPVRFSEINNVVILVEIALMREDLVPELSYGTHFFQDLVETDIFYAAIFPDSAEVIFNKPWLDALPNDLESIIAEPTGYRAILKVHDLTTPLLLMSDIATQRLICFRQA